MMHGQKNIKLLRAVIKCGKKMLQKKRVIRTRQIFFVYRC